MLMLAFPGLTLEEAMSMKYRHRNVFIRAYNRVHK